MFKRSILIIASVLMFSFTASAQYDFYSGKDWSQINDKPFSADTKKRVKETLIRTVQGASTFSGSPVLPAHETNISEYSALLDEYYADPAVKDVPLHFAMKIVNMHKQGVTDAQISIYQTEILKKTIPQAGK